MSDFIVKLGRYRHFKGNMYQVLLMATHSETEEPMVVYQALYGKNEIWVRPLTMFCDTVDFEGKKVPRFEYLPDAASE